MHKRRGVWWRTRDPCSPVQEQNLHVHVVAVLVQKVLEEVRDALECDVSTYHDVPGTVGERQDALADITQQVGSAAAGRFDVTKHATRLLGCQSRGLADAVSCAHP